MVIFTNTVRTDAYRGAGRPEATFVLERLVDVAARDLGIDRIEIRRRNFIPRDAFPYQTPVMLQYDSGDHDATLVKALECSISSRLLTHKSSRISGRTPYVCCHARARAAAPA